MRIILLILSICFSFHNKLAFAENLRLLMAETSNCYYCELWHEQIGEIYSKTQEGARAPILRWDVFTNLPKGVFIKEPIVYTPTFILLSNNSEVNRLEGYHGEDFFWPLLSELLELVGD